MLCEKLPSLLANSNCCLGRFSAPPNISHFTQMRVLLENAWEVDWWPWKRMIWGWGCVWINSIILMTWLQANLKNRMVGLFVNKKMASGFVGLDTLSFVK
jgi:hypothetical protein